MGDLWGNIDYAAFVVLFCIGLYGALARRNAEQAFRRRFRLGAAEERIEPAAQTSFFNHGQAGALVFCGIWRRVISLASAM